MDHVVREWARSEKSRSTPNVVISHSDGIRKGDGRCIVREKGDFVRAREFGLVTYVIEAPHSVVDGEAPFGAVFACALDVPMRHHLVHIKKPFHLLVEHLLYDHRQSNSKSICPRGALEPDYLRADERAVGSLRFGEF